MTIVVCVIWEEKTNKPNSAEDKPQNYVTQNGNTLTLTYMKSESLRSGDNYMKSEITSHDESSNLNRPYTAFEFKTELVYKDRNDEKMVVEGDKYFD